MYRLRLKHSAQKELDALDPSAGGPVEQAISSLAENPRPPGLKKLQQVGAWRIRVGDYRVVYEIDDGARLVTVVKIGHRRDVYRDWG